MFLEGVKKLTKDLRIEPWTGRSDPSVDLKTHQKQASTYIIVTYCLHWSFQIHKPLDSALKTDYNNEFAMLT